MGPPGSQSGHSTSRYQNQKNHTPTASKRHATTSTVNSADSSDLDDDRIEGLPDSGLVAPWEVLRGLADVAIERAAKVRPSQNINERTVSTRIKGKWRVERTSQSY